MLAAYSAFVLIGVAHHEPWADEAQAWVMARDMSLGKMLFSEMHYEVSPGLWNAILWVAQHVFHAPYAAMNWIGAAFAIAGAALLIFCAPFPRVVRYLMASSFYISYQYAVIARPYVMLLVFAAGAAIFYRRRQPIAMAVFVALLTLVSIHGAILAGAITAGAVWRVLSQWKDLTPGERQGQLLGLTIVLAGVVLLFATAYPAPDILAVGSLRSGGIHKFASALEHAIVPHWYVAALLLALMVAFAAWRREALVFLLGVGGLTTFQGFFYGGPHHEGAIVVAITTALWIAYPSRGEKLPTWYRPEIAAIILCGIFAVQSWEAVRAWRYDYAHPYSGAADMARFMHEISVQQNEISAFSYFDVALQPYFDHNIFSNWPRAYVHHSAEGEPPPWKIEDENRSRYIVTPFLRGDNDPTAVLLLPKGYVVRHVSPGRVLFDAGLWSTETFTLYEKVR